MKIQISLVVNDEDPRYNGDCESPNFNDGVLCEWEENFITAEDLWKQLYRYETYKGVETYFGELEEEDKQICFIEHKLERKNDLFEQDVKLHSKEA